MNIGSVAEKSGVSPKTIRYYETIGLIVPANRRANGYRSYSDADMRTLNFIKRARGLGFSVDEVRELLILRRSKTRTSVAVKLLAVRHLQVLDRKLEELGTMRSLLAGLIERCRGDVGPQCAILDDLEQEGPAAHLRQRLRLRRRPGMQGHTS